LPFFKMSGGINLERSIANDCARSSTSAETLTNLLLQETPPRSERLRMLVDGVAGLGAPGQ
jgi:hypothetical protein